jgi:glycogen(starch) synthase
MASTLSASIVIVTFNRADSLDRTLASLQQLRYRNFEVLVVDGPSTDHTHEVIAKHAAFVRAFSHDLNNISISRNIGVAHARGEVVAFIDDDAIPEPDWLEKLLAAYTDREIVAVGGFIRDATGFEYQSRYTVCDRYGDARQFGDPSEFTLDDETFLSLTGANFSARRENLIVIGGFDEEYVWFLDETDVNLRMHDLGWKFAVAPDAEMHHKFEVGLPRANAKVPRTMYPQLRSKAYFCVTHNLRRKRLFDILAYLVNYVAKEREWKRDLARDGLTDAATVDRLIAEVERGVEDGVADALRLTAPVGLSERALADAKSGAFKLFPQKLRAEQRLRVCLFSREYPPLGHGGIAQWTREVATGLAARGHEVTVISRALDGCKRIEFLEGVWVHRIEAEPISQDEADAFAPAPAALTAYSYALLREFERIDGHRCFDLISAPIADLEGLVSRRLARAPVIVSLHTTYKLSMPFKPDWLSRPEYLAKHVEPTIACENQILGECSHILANSRAIVTDIETAHAISIDRSKVEIIPHGISDLSAGVTPPVASDERVHLLFVGRLEERKGADALLAILPGLLGRYENLVAHIVGEDAIPVGETTLRAAYERDNADRPKILDRTIFHGALPRERVVEHYVACDIFVAP